MAAAKLGSKAAGSTVKLKVSGTLRDFIVVHQGRPDSMYDASCDGVWLLMKDCLETKLWHNVSVNDYANSDVHSYLNGTFLSKLDANIQAKVKQVKIPYRKGSGDSPTITSGANGLSAKIFLLSLPEVGYATGVSYGPVDGAKLSYFDEGAGADAKNKRIGKYNNSAVAWWLRSPRLMGSNSAFIINSSGAAGSTGCTAGQYLRPALILPSDLLVSGDGTVMVNTAPAAPSSISVPATINGGSTITVSWNAATDAEGNLEGYKVERSTDGGSTWAQVYQGSGRSTTNTVQFGTESVMYRVRAYDSEGLASGWRTSGQVAVINNTAPTVPDGITVPEQVQGGQPLTVAWGPAVDGENNLAGYSLERQVDGGDWETVYTGEELSYIDAITKGWQTVAYRVRAYDTANAYSGFAISEAREVNNNTPPAITCDAPGHSSLGERNEAFAVSYSVSDEEGDEITVTEAIDGVVVRTFAAEPEADYSFDVSGLTFMRLLNGSHALTITASDGRGSTVHSLAFTKLVTAASVTLERPMPADGPISVCVLSVSGSIPADAEYRVEVTNNAMDDDPVWEDCTAAVRSCSGHVFANDTAANGFAFNFRLAVKRGPSGLGGYITSVQGGFQ